MSDAEESRRVADLLSKIMNRTMEEHEKQSLKSTLLKRAHTISLSKSIRDPFTAVHGVDDGEVADYLEEQWKSCEKVFSELAKTDPKAAFSTTLIMGLDVGFQAGKETNKDTDKE